MWTLTKIPIVQAPMAGAQGPRLCIAVCEAGGLGSIPCAMLTADILRAQIAEIRAATKAPFNVNFFAHTPPTADPAREAAWVEKLSGYYAEFGLDPADAAKGPGRAPFDDATCAVVEEMRPPVVSFHFGLPQPDLLARVKATGAQIWSS
ncbi:MAG: nitronate monooxygenase, partial [Rhodoblastus sp.]